MPSKGGTDVENNEESQGVDPGTTEQQLMGSMDDLKKHVEANQGVATVYMGVVRDAYGSGKLGKHIVDNIAKALQGLGLGYYPDPLPSYQEAMVRLYKMGSPVGQLIEAASSIGLERDEVLRQAAGGEAAEVVAKIRELVCS